MTKRAFSAALGPGLLALAVAGLGFSAAAAVPGELRFARLNRGYSEVATEIEPVEEGPVAIRLSSPRNSLTVRDHVLRLEPGAGNSQTADLRVEFSGKGWLVADVEVGSFNTRLQDEVVVPPQALEIQGRVRVRKVQGGYEVTPEQLPSRVSIRIQSGLGRRLVELCDSASVLPLADLDCPALQQALTRAVISLPAPGESFLLADAEMTPQERQQLDGYLRSGLRSGR